MKRPRPEPRALLFELDGVLLDNSSGAGHPWLHDGVREMLAALALAGYPLGVVTGMERRSWEAYEATFTPSRFAVVITADETTAPAPHPAGMLAAARGLALEPRHVAFIGASPRGLAAARAAGMQVAAALWQAHDTGRNDPTSTIAGEAPDWEFARPAEVTRTFAAWC